MRNYLIASLLLLATPCLAADPPPAAAPAAPPLLPITVSAADLTNLQTYLAAQPYSFSAPLINYLAAREQAAQEAATPAKK